MKNLPELQRTIHAVLQKEFVSILQSDKGYAVLTNLSDKILSVQIKDKVKRYCERFVRQEVIKTFNDLGLSGKIKIGEKTSTQSSFPICKCMTSCQGSDSEHMPKPHQCKNYQISSDYFRDSKEGLIEKKSEKEKLKNIQSAKPKLKDPKHKKSHFLKKIKSQEKIPCLKAQALDLPTDINLAQVSGKTKMGKEKKLKKSKSQRSTSKVMVVNSAESSSKGFKIQLNILDEEQIAKDKIRKVQKHLQKISDHDSVYGFQDDEKMEKLVKDNIHMGSKQIAHLIKGMKDIQNLSKVSKIQSNQIDLDSSNSHNSPFHLPSGVFRNKSKKKDSQFFSQTERDSRDRGESQYLQREDYLHSPYQTKGLSFEDQVRKKSSKSNRQKGRIFLKMMQVYGQSSRTEMFNFIEKNEHLPDNQIIERWDAGP